MVSGFVVIANMNCLLWNIRGIGKGERTISIRKIVEEKKVSFMGLVETKHKRTIRNRMKRMWGNDDFDICEIFAGETNGGVVIAAWDNTTFSVSLKHTGGRWILLEDCIIRHNFECCVGVIYGHNDRTGKLALFEVLKEKVATINKPILLMGDFNVVLLAGERIKSFRCDRSMREFLEWIMDMDLIYIPLHGVKFTWRRTESKSKLDRGLCCYAWLRKFPNLNMVMVGLKRSFSDHNPLLLSLEDKNNWGPKPFRCYDAWFLNPRFKDHLINEWRNIPNESLHNKLKSLKAPLKTWRKENFDLMDDNIFELEYAIHDLDSLTDDRDLNDMERARLNAANYMLHQWLIRRERLWRQRARSYGFSTKDHNTKFFHELSVLGGEQS